MSSEMGEAIRQLIQEKGYTEESVKNIIQNTSDSEVFSA